MDRLDELALLLAILDRGSLSAAARKTRRSPAAVTRILNDLEGRLNVRLFERTTRRITPTEAGVMFAEHARRLLDGYDNALHDVTGTATTPSGVLRVTAPLLFGRRHLAPIVWRFLDRHPKISAELLLTNEIVDLVARTVDVGLRIGRLVDSGLVARCVGHVRRVVLASPDYLAKQGEPASPNELNRHQLVVQSAGEGLTGWHFVLANDMGTTVRPRGRLVVNQAETAIEAACAGRGLIRCLSYQVADEVARGELVRVLRPFEPPALPVNLVFTGRRLMAQRVRTFVDFAVAELQAHPALHGQ
jgi:DNA-binding transcriptional LysR family regulator